MVSQWTTVTFGEVVRLEQGLCFNKKTNHLMAETGIPLLRIADLVNNTQTKFVDEERVPKKFIANPQDIIYSRTGQVGLVFKGKVGVVHNNCFRIIPQEGIERDYVYWYLRQPSIIQKARSLAGGAAQPDLGHDAFKSIPFIYPELETQRRIVGILSAYDDLIENNTRRIKILEEMAQALYREWFVKYRFPGHEKVKMVESELGMVPEGWEVKKLGDVVELAYGKALKADDRVEGSFPVYGSSGVIGYHNECFVKGPGIIVGRKGNVGSIFWSDYDFFPIDTVYYVKSTILLPYIFYNLQSQNFINNDAAVPGLNRNQAYMLPFLLPTKDVLLKFENFIKDVFKHTNNLRNKYANLCRTRDLLLPKLISGDFDVTKFDVK